MLDEFCGDMDRFLITAHRGFSSKYPENTLLAFGKAIELGVDLIEFDVRMSSDGIPVILHDETVDRTSDGHGRPEDIMLDELRHYNFSYWHGTHDKGMRLKSPSVPEMAIPTLDELFAAFAGRVAMNIQLYIADEDSIRKIVNMYQNYEMYKTGYLTVSTFLHGNFIRSLDNNIELCVLESQGRMDIKALKDLKEFGCRFIQPLGSDASESLCQFCRDNGMRENMFFSNTSEDNKHFLEIGLRGILTDCPDILQKTLNNAELEK